ncbi:MAG: aldo/keto reductase [Eubacteriales bacterium]|nr:aldo/keto reductase [Eubacteriales bacterium]MDY4397398.1 aldo/keto reductase [Eubacteriales bacterium]MDY4896194.1 aldo/keto reductase [Eubacteriales bacterium]MDY5366318.1 aldo/keto reductase [Eubacteriales bacterium]MDY5625306.1 aldo/keto reductase [Eubacteriales bacterium]
MEYTNLGNTGLKVSRLGFGGIPIQRITQEEATALIHKLPEYGINYIDTARGYTVSEEYLGIAMEGIRDKFVLATKSMARTREAMEKDIETSLKNLRTDHIDLYQVHNAPPAQMKIVTGEGGALEALLEAKAAGKIGHIGITAHEIGTFEMGLEMDWVETIMFPYNFVELQAADLIRKCAEKGKGFICMKPLAGGAIENAPLAMRFIASNKDITVNIPGMANEDELKQNVAAACDPAPLSEDDLKEVQNIRDTLGNQFCRRCNYCQPCTMGINISFCFTINGYLTRYGLKDWAIGRYKGMAVEPNACIECGMCESRCPYHLPIIEMLKDVYSNFQKEIK